MRATDAAARHEAGVRPLLDPARPTVFVLRGPSGSGKSSLAARIVSSLRPGVRAALCSADSYFEGPDGCYRFVPDELRYAHAACRQRFDAALRDRVPVVVVDNTHSARWEYAPFVAGVVAFNSAVEAGLIVGVGGGAQDDGADGGGDDDGGGGGGLTVARGGGSGSGGGGWAASGFVGAGQWVASCGDRNDAACASVFAARDAAARRGPPVAGGYRLVVVELHVPDAQALQQCVARGAHGVPRDTTVRQWEGLRRNLDPTAVHVPALLAGSSSRSGGGAVASVAGAARVVVHAPALASASAVVQPGASWRALAAHASTPPAAHVVVSAPPRRLGDDESAVAAAPRSNLLPSQLQFGAPSSAHAGWRPHGGRGGGQGVEGGAAAFLVAPPPPPPAPRHPPRLPSDCFVVYVGLFLTPTSREELLAHIAPEFDAVHGDHVTVAHAPRASTLSHALLAAVGATVSLEVTALYTSYRRGAQAVTVAWPRARHRASAARRSSSSSPSSEASSSSRGGSSRDDDDGDDDGGSDGGGSDGGGHVEEGGSSPHDDASPQVTVTDRSVEPPEPAAAAAAAAGHSDGPVRELLAGLVSSNGGAPPARSSTRGLSTNSVPHVTVSVRAGVLPLTSNTMLQHPASFSSRSKGGRPPAGVKLKFARAERPVVSVRLGLCVARGSFRWYVASQGALQRWLADAF